MVQHCKSAHRLSLPPFTDEGMPCKQLYFKRHDGKNVWQTQQESSNMFLVQEVSNCYQYTHSIAQRSMASRIRMHDVLVRSYCTCVYDLWTEYIESRLPCYHVIGEPRPIHEKKQLEHRKWNIPKYSQRYAQ